MIAEIDIDNDNKIIQRTVTGELDTNRALELVQNVFLAAQLHHGYSILVDIKATTFEPEMDDLLDIAAECSKRRKDFNHKIAFLIPDTEQRRKTARYFKTCMDIRGFKFKQFFNYKAAKEWLSSSTMDNQSTSDQIQKAS